MKIVITGGSGFVGKHLIKKLKKSDINFVVFDKAKHNLFKPETLEDFLDATDIVVHLAGVNRDDDFSKIMKVNILGTEGLLNAMTRFCPNAKIIFASSFQAYLQQNIYGASKKVAEEIIKNYTEQTKIKGIILRFTNMYGSGGKPFYNSAIATFAYEIKRGQSITINGDGKQKRDYLYVGDGVDAIIKAFYYAPKRNDCFDICSGKQFSLNKVVDILRTHSPKNINVRYNKEIKSDDWDFVKDYEKAKKNLKWKPKTSIEKGLKILMKD